METCFRESETLLDVPGLRTLWARFRILPRTQADLMTHGDLIPANLLVHDGRLTGVLDIGGFSPANPALDLVAVWHLFDVDARSVFRDTLSIGLTKWQRGAAWAFQQAMGLVWYTRCPILEWLSLIAACSHASRTMTSLRAPFLLSGERFANSACIRHPGYPGGGLVLIQ